MLTFVASSFSSQSFIHLSIDDPEPFLTHSASFPAPNQSAACHLKPNGYHSIKNCFSDTFFLSLFLNKSSSRFHLVIYVSILFFFHGENEEKATATPCIFHDFEGFSHIISEVLILSIWKEASVDSLRCLTNLYIILQLINKLFSLVALETFRKRNLKEINKNCPRYRHPLQRRS